MVLQKYYTKNTFKSKTFLLTGDAGKDAEEEMLSSGIDLHAMF